MSTRNQTKIKNVLILAALALAVFAGPALAAIPVPTGINPATGVEWANGDTYRLVFMTSAMRDAATSTDINVYNAFVQAAADASTAYDIGADDGATWKVIGSTPTVDARDNTSTNPTVETGHAIFLLDGATVVANDYADLWDGEIQNIIDLDENGAEPAVPWPVTGTMLDGTAANPGDFGCFGAPASGKVTQGAALDPARWVWRAWTGANAGPMYAMSDPLVIGGGGPTNISPEDESTVDVGNVDLLWKNMDSKSPGDFVYVDVWFGTDPDPKNGTKDVTEEPNETSVTVPAPVADTYYWQVVNYSNGLGHINEPNAIEGPVWSFNATEDLPPSVDIDTPDMITWSGQKVGLAATVVDDGESALTILWTAVPADGVSWPDGDNVVDPNVTITKDAPTGDATTVTLTVKVNDAGNPTTFDTDTMTIDVYDNACLAAIGAGLVIDQTDFDANCITDLRDYAVFAAKWLVDIALTAPVPK